MPIKFSLLLTCLFIVSSCNYKSENKRLEKNIKENNSLLEILIKHKNFAQSRLQLQPLTKLKDTIIRIWSFPGGAGGYVDLYEINTDKSELTQYRSLTNSISKAEIEREKIDISELEFVKKFENDKIVFEFSEFRRKNSFLDIENSHNYFKERPGCRDVYLVECKEEESLKIFEIDSDIKNCTTTKSQSIRSLLAIIEKMKKNIDED